MKGKPEDKTFVAEVTAAGLLYLFVHAHTANVMAVPAVSESKHRSVSQKQKYIFIGLQNS